MVCFENYRELVSAMCDQNTEILISLTVCTHNNEWAIKIKACPLIRKESLDGFRVAYAAVQRMFFSERNLKREFGKRLLPTNRPCIQGLACWSASKCTNSICNFGFVNFWPSTRYFYITTTDSRMLERTLGDSHVILISDINLGIYLKIVTYVSYGGVIWAAVMTYLGPVQSS